MVTDSSRIIERVAENAEGAAVEVKPINEETNANAQTGKRVVESGYSYIPAEYYFANKTTKYKYSIFSTLDILNRNSALFKGTKFSVATIIKTIYTPEEIASLIEQTGVTSFEGLTKRIEKALNGKENGVAINAVANNVTKFVKQLKAGKNIDYVEQGTNKFAKTQFNQFTNGPQALVEHCTNVNGTNQYYANSIVAYIGELTPLFTKFKTDAEADAITSKIEKAVKEKYNYTFKIGHKNQKAKLSRTISIRNSASKMDNCINMLYSLSKTLVGSKKAKLKAAKAIINNTEQNEFLSSKHKFNLNGQNQKVSKIYSAHQSTIEDVVTTLTTIFLARFYFDSKYFSQIEKDLTEQACYKMQELRINKNPNEDYWINQLIQERLQLNVAQICASEGITNANQLLEIYNNNGTVIAHPERIHSINDLVFSLQYNLSNEKANNKPLENIAQNKVNVQATKKSDVKVKPHYPKEPKKNVYLDAIRKTDEYKKWLAYYKEKLSEVKLDKNEDVSAKLAKIKENSEDNLSNIEKLGQNAAISDEDKKALVEVAAINDAVNDKCDENINEESQDEKNDETSKPNPDVVVDENGKEVPVVAAEEVDGEDNRQKIISKSKNNEIKMDAYSTLYPVGEENIFSLYSNEPTAVDTKTEYAVRSDVDLTKGLDFVTARKYNEQTIEELEGEDIQPDSKNEGIKLDKDTTYFQKPNEGDENIDAPEISVKEEPEKVEDEFEPYQLNMEETLGIPPFDPGHLVTDEEIQQEQKDNVAIRVKAKENTKEEKIAAAKQAYEEENSSNKRLRMMQDYEYKLDENFEDKSFISKDMVDELLDLRTTAERIAAAEEAFKEESSRVNREVTMEDIEAEYSTLSENFRISIDGININNEEPKVPEKFIITKKLSEYTDEEIAQKLKKFYERLIYGSNSKAGILATDLSFRVVEPKKTKSGDIPSDNQRLSDKELSKVTKIRDEQVEKVIADFVNATFLYYSNNKNNLPENTTIAKLCNEMIKEITENEKANLRDLKGLIAVYITKMTNKKIKDLNIELYTGKSTFKKYGDLISIEGEEREN